MTGADEPGEWLSLYVDNTRAMGQATPELVAPVKLRLSLTVRPVLEVAYPCSADVVTDAARC